MFTPNSLSGDLLLRCGKASTELAWAGFDLGLFLALTFGATLTLLVDGVERHILLKWSVLPHLPQVLPFAGH